MIGSPMIGYLNRMGVTNSSGLSTPKPYVEPDQQSKLASIFDAASGIITKLGEVYTSIRYAPKPAEQTGVSKPSYFSLFDSEATPETRVASAIPLILLIGGIVALFLILRR